MRHFYITGGIYGFRYEIQWRFISGNLRRISIVCDHWVSTDKNQPDTPDTFAYLCMRSRRLAASFPDNPVNITGNRRNLQRILGIYSVSDSCSRCGSIRMVSVS